MKCLTKYYMNKGENIANEAIEWLKHADLNVYLISYIMISKHFNLDITICFIQFFANDSINMLEILKPLGFEECCFEEELTLFSHLTICHNMLHTLIIQNANVHIQKGTLSLDHTIHGANGIPKFPLEVMFSLIEPNSCNTMALVIEESDNDIEIKHSRALEVKLKGILSSSEERIVRKVHLIHPSANQCYHSFRFHRNPHYGVKVKHLQLIKWILSYWNITFEEYQSNIMIHSNPSLTICNDISYDWFPYEKFYAILKSNNKLKSRNISNLFVSYGYSAMYCGNNGEPKLTKYIDKFHDKGEKLLPIVLPVLIHLSSELRKYYGHVAPDFYRNQSYAQQMGSNFNYSMIGSNIYEGFDLSIIYSPTILTPHCDVMNDWRPGYDYLSVIKTTFIDQSENKTVTLSLICYTRKAIGDYLKRQRCSMDTVIGLPPYFKGMDTNTSGNKTNSTRKRRVKEMQRLEKEMELALNIKINDETCNMPNLCNAMYLNMGGYPKNMITEALLQKFYHAYNHRKKRFIAPPYLQPFNQYWVKIETFNESFKLLSHQILKFLVIMEGRKGHYKCITGTNMWRIYLHESKFNKCPEFAKFNDKLRQNSIEYFIENGWEKKGILANTIKIFGIFTLGKTEEIQNVHTDHPFVNEHQVKMSETKYAWTAHMPITTEGMWITVWFAPGLGNTFQVKFGDILYLRSDVVYALGTPMTEDADGERKHYHLQYYLPTNDQPICPCTFNTKDRDNVTNLSQIYYLPKRKIEG